MAEHHENADYIHGTSCSAIQKDPVLEAPDIISQGTELTSHALMQELEQKAPLM